MVADPLFGPVMACGAGGIQAELLKDVQVRICPISARDASRDDPVAGDLPAAHRLPRRGCARLAALEDVLVRMSAMVEAHHEIAELDLNPVIAGPDGAMAVDARIRVADAPPPRPWPSTWKAES